LESPNADRERLLSLLKTKSYREGRVVLASGRESDFYIDCRQTSLSAEGHRLIGRLFFGLISEKFPQATAVGGPTLGADPLVSAVSLTSILLGRSLDAFIVRKEAKGHGTGTWIEGMANLKKGDTVVMLEDVVTTGGSSLQAVKRAEAVGLKVPGILVLVDRNEGGKENIEKAGYTLVSLYNKSDFMPSA
jgi:orotate phosphoribosyltransferase